MQILGGSNGEIDIPNAAVKFVNPQDAVMNFQLQSGVNTDQEIDLNALNRSGSAMYQFLFNFGGGTGGIFAIKDARVGPISFGMGGAANAATFIRAAGTGTLQLNEGGGNLVETGTTFQCSGSGTCNLGTASHGFGTGLFTGQITSSLGTGTAPFSIASATLVPNLNTQVLNGVTVSGAAANGNVLTASSSSAASWAAPALATSSVAGVIIPRDLHAIDASGNLDFEPNDANVFELRDDFATGSSSSTAQIGLLGWSIGTITTAATYSQSAVSFPHLGIERITTAATAATGGTLFLGPGTIATIPSLAANAGWSATWIFRLGQTATTSFRVGFASTTTATAPTSGVWLRYDTASSDTAFKVECINSSASTVGGTTYTVDTNWHKIKVASTTAGQVTFTFDNNAPQTITSNVPTAGLFPIMIMTTQAASAEFAEADFFAMKWRGLGR